MENRNTLSLIELNTLVRKSIETCLPSTYWITAELSDVRTNASGHCYMEFVQKNDHNGSLVARAKGMIWANLFNMLRPYFEEATGEQFRSGLKVLVEVEVQFHELYGYSLVVVNIDPTYTLGDIVKRRQEIIKQLKEEGVIDLNREIEFPLLPQRIAVISSATAAGYGDFINQLTNNEYGLKFYVELFPAIMQGEQVESSILKALDKIFQKRDHFDVVTIIRGGGASSDLSGFDTYLLATACAQFPLPIITGIGHERDDTILDLVSNQRVKTPTAAAALILSRVLETTTVFTNLASRLRQGVKQTLINQQDYLRNLKSQLPSFAKISIANSKFEIHKLQTKLKTGTSFLFSELKHKLESYSQEIKAASPETILKRGYAIIKQNGKIQTSIYQISAKDDIEIEMKDGEIKTHVK